MPNTSVEKYLQHPNRGYAQAQHEAMVDEMQVENYGLQPTEKPVPAKRHSEEETEYMSQMFARALCLKWINRRLSRTAIVRRM